MSRRRFIRGRFSRKRVHNVNDLNLTSLTDMFAFLLCVLLKSVSVSSVDIKPSANVKLPSSASKELPQRFVAFDIQRQGIYLEKKLIQPLQDFVLPEQEPNQDTMFNLRNAVMDHIKQGKIQSTVMVIRADREAPFDIIWRVMYTARQLGFEEFQNLAVQEVKNKTI